MTAIGGIVGDVVDDDRFVALPNFVANRGFDLQLPAGDQAEGDLIPNGAANPAVFGHTRDRGEAHSGRTANHFKDTRYGVDTLHGSNIRAQVGHHLVL
jgi:hypothetical protein